jgi:hypothetical protein
MAFWRPNCPDGYVSLSDIGNTKNKCTVGDIKPPNAVEDNAFRCVHQNLTIETDYGYPVFSSRNLGANGDGQIFSINGRMDGIRVERSGGKGKDDNRQHRLSNIPVALLFKDLTEVLTLSNPTATEQKMTFSLQRGLTSTRSIETMQSTEFRSDFSVKVGTGEAAKAVTDVEATASFGVTQLTGTTVSQSDITSVMQTTTIEVTVPPFSLARLAQVVIIDSPLGSAVSATSLFTSNYALQIELMNSTDTGMNSTRNDSGTNSTPRGSVSCEDILANIAEIAGLQRSANAILFGTETRLRATAMTVEENNGLLLDILEETKKPVGKSKR